MFKQFLIGLKQNLREEDNLSTRDKWPVPKVPSVRRFYCSVNLLAILVVTGVLVVWAWISGGVYRNWCLDVLEGLFALNLIILAAATLSNWLRLHMMSSSHKDINKLFTHKLPLSLLSKPLTPPVSKKLNQRMAWEHS